MPNRLKETIKEYLKRYGSEVEIVVMDMSPSFKSAVRHSLGRPVIVADRFHYCRYIYWALDSVRREGLKGMARIRQEKVQENAACAL